MGCTVYRVLNRSSAARGVLCTVYSTDLELHGVYCVLHRSDAARGVLCTVYSTGLVLHGVYYACFGHPWVDINGPKFSRDEDEKTLVIAYYRQGKMNKLTVRSCCDISQREEEPDDDVYR